VKPGHHLIAVATATFAVVWSVLISLVLVAEFSGNLIGNRLLTAKEVLIWACSIPRVWLGAFAVRWWLAFLDERGF